jgi:hypothetical protein
MKESRIGSMRFTVESKELIANAEVLLNPQHA